ncbi:MAG: hypothetical protein DMF53_13355 [Acidobacteria bacterium]|nr:MAG: hypothetical protein DMF53_13355 [Acidobacteriota bacterium]
MKILPFPSLRTAALASILRRALGCMPGLVTALALGCAAGPQPASAPPAAPVAASPGPAVKVEPRPLSPGVPLVRELPPGGRDEIPLDLREGTYIRFFFDATPLDLDVRLLGPSGEQIAGVEASEGRLSTIATTAGRYRFAVSPLNPKTGGPYRLTLEELRPSSPGDADRVEADAALAAAIHLSIQGEYEQAIKKAEEALSRFRKAQDHNGEFEVLYEIGNSWSVLSGGKDAALRAYQEGLAVAEAAGSRRNKARALMVLGSLLTQPRAVTDAEKARDFLEQALPIWQELGDSYHQAWVLYYLAIGRYTMGRFDEAIELYQTALSLTGPAGLASNIWNGLGNVYTARGESLKALECFDTALRIAGESEDKAVEAAALTSAGNVYQRRGEPQKALQNFKEALAINQSDPALKIYEGQVLLQIGSLNMDLGQPEEAFAVYQRSLRLSQDYGDAALIANALWSIGRVDLVRGNPQDALAHFEKGLEIATSTKNARIQAAILHEIGMARLKLRQYPEAVGSLEKALPLRQKTDRLGEALTRQALGKAYLEEGDLERAGSFLGDALKIADEVGASLVRSAIHYDLARLQRRQDRLPEALSEIETAIAILEAVRSDMISGWTCSWSSNGGSPGKGTRERLCGRARRDMPAASSTCCRRGVSS